MTWGARRDPPTVPETAGTGTTPVGVLVNNPHPSHSSTGRDTDSVEVSLYEGSVFYTRVGDKTRGYTVSVNLPLDRDVVLGW